jgi:hypothetical protein
LPSAGESFAHQAMFLQLRNGFARAAVAGAGRPASHDTVGDPV